MEVLQTLQITWFALWGLLWAVYFMLDGFVLGTGMLHNFLAKNEKEKQAMVAIVGPVWNGNEVWLITAGGATFAAFPTAYALMFSYLYTALLLLLFALIIRGVSLEFRGKVANSGWKRLWDAGILLGRFSACTSARRSLWQHLQRSAHGCVRLSWEPVHLAEPLRASHRGPFCHVVRGAWGNLYLCQDQC